MKFTVKSTAALELPTGRSDHVFWEDSIPGFGLRLRSGGSRNWVFQYKLGKKQRRMSLGSATAILLVDARRTATELYAKVKLGKDPQGEKEHAKTAAADIFEVTVRRYLAARKKDTRPGTYSEIERHLDRHCRPLHRLGLAGIEQRTVATRLNEIREASGDVAANRVRSSLSAFYSWAMQEGIVTHNPVANTRKSDEKPRSRVLADDEIRDVWAALDVPNVKDMPPCFARLARTLFFTAMRRTEASRLAWPEIERRHQDGYDGETACIPGSRMKGKLDHAAPLTPPVLVLIGDRPKDAKVRPFIFSTDGGRRPFSSYSKAKKALDKEIAKLRKAEGRAPMPPWQLSRDIRRTAKTLMARAGVRPDISERCLAHVIPGVEGTYDRWSYLPEKANALESLSSLIDRIIHPVNNIVAMRG